MDRVIRGARCIGLTVLGGQVDAEPCRAVGRAENGDCAAHALAKALNDCEAKTDPAILLCIISMDLREGFEQARLIGFADAIAGIDHVNLQAILVKAHVDED